MVEIRKEKLEERQKRAMEVVDIVDDIERVRVKAHKMGRTNNGFVHSLSVVLDELQKDYNEHRHENRLAINNIGHGISALAGNGPGGGGDSIDQLKQSMDGTRTTGLGLSAKRYHTDAEITTLSKF